MLFLHANEVNDNDKMEIDEPINEQVFHQAPEKTPPDQLETILQMMRKLSSQVEQLEKISTNVQLTPSFGHLQ